MDGDEESRGRLYRFWRGHRKVKYMEPLVGEGGEVGRVYRFWGGCKKVEYLKTLVRRRGRKHI